MGERIVDEAAEHFNVLHSRQELNVDILGNLEIMAGGTLQQKDVYGMGRRLYVGNLSYNTTEDDLRELFAAYGTVDSLNLITDRDTGRPKGFGFVEMSTDEEARAAISGLNAREVDGRQIRVDEANERPPRRSEGRW